MDKHSNVIFYQHDVLQDFMEQIRKLFDGIPEWLNLRTAVSWFQIPESGIVYKISHTTLKCSIKIFPGKFLNVQSAVYAMLHVHMHIEHIIVHLTLA